MTREFGRRRAAGDELDQVGEHAVGGPYVGRVEMQRSGRAGPSAPAAAGRGGGAAGVYQLSERNGSAGRPAPLKRLASGALDQA
jgi:hypothetical protein